MDYGFLELVKGFRAQLRGLPVLSVPHFDIIIFVSPEYRIDYVREFIDKSKPKVWNLGARCGSLGAGGSGEASRHFVVLCAAPSTRLCRALLPC